MRGMRKVKVELYNQSGQAIVEYILTVLIAISVVTVISAGFKGTVIRLWQGMAREIAAPCPSCVKDQTIRITGAAKKR